MRYALITRTERLKGRMVESAEAVRARLANGEPGIGKSRLVWQFQELDGVRYSWLESFCSPFEVNTPFAPVGNLITASYI
jgi:hypothetical protein